MERVLKVLVVDDGPHVHQGQDAAPRNGLPLRRSACGMFLGLGAPARRGAHGLSCEGNRGLGRLEHIETSQTRRRRSLQRLRLVGSCTLCRGGAEGEAA
jgi:hypothetical protein